METDGYTAIGLNAEPDWPSGDGPYLFLLEESGPVERRILQSWIERRCPDSVEPGAVQEATLPQTRRRIRRRRPDPRLDAFLATEDDPLLVPLRVAWLPSTESDGFRRVGLRDMLRFGDPRDPGPLSQYVIFRTRPDRCRIIMGAPARASEIAARWQDQGTARGPAGLSLSGFTANRAWLSLERAEREVRGDRYKVPKFVHEELVARRSFTAGVAQLARETGTAYRQMEFRTRRYVREIAATHSPYVIDLVNGATRWLISKAYVDLWYSTHELARIYELGRQRPVVFLPSHKSNFDHLVLQYVLYQNGLPPNHTAGGINMNFFPVGPIIRRSGVFFIRREFRDNEPYKFVLRQYIDFLLEKRFPLEWYIEGGRSRTGRMREPRYGMLAYVVDSVRRGSTDDVALIPVSIAYDQIQDVADYTAEASSGIKKKESFAWLMNAIRRLRVHYGAVHIRFGNVISLRDFLGDDDGTGEIDSNVVPKLAFEVAVGINEATPITPISLVTLGLLSAPNRELSVDQMLELLGPHIEFINRRALPTTQPLRTDDRAMIHTALDALASHGVVRRDPEPTGVVYSVGAEQELAAAYYRNTVVHHFVNGAISELALVAALERESEDPVAQVLDDALVTRDLLKFEFFFAPSAEFRHQIEFELKDRDSDWQAHVAAGSAKASLERFRPFRAGAVLRPILEGYMVVADLITWADGEVDRDQILNDAADLAEVYLENGRIASKESGSPAVIHGALRLAAQRRLLEDREDVELARAEFAAQVQELVERFAILDAMARRVGKPAD